MTWPIPAASNDSSVEDDLMCIKYFSSFIIIIIIFLAIADTPHCHNKHVNVLQYSNAKRHYSTCTLGFFRGSFLKCR